MSERILIIDDDLETVRLISLVLNRQGYQTLTSYNGLDGIQQTTNEKPDLVLLDVMMPDIDGYQVTRRLRGNPETANIPILMFSAKSQVDDRVSGYESGIDDYLTKPIHPAELIARVKSLISRTKTSLQEPVDKGYMIGIAAPIGGLGCSTLAINLAIRYHQNTRKDVIAAEMRPGHGCWGTELRQTNKHGLANLLKQNPTAISSETVEKELVRTSYGTKLLLSSNEIEELQLLNAQSQMEAVARNLPLLADLTILDIGSSAMPNLVNILAECNEILVVTAPFPSVIQFTKDFITQIQEKGVGKSQLISPVLLNRVRADMQYSVSKCEEMLGKSVKHVITPVPEISHQAAQGFKPLILQAPPESLLVTQFHKIAESIIENMKT